MGENLDENLKEQTNNRPWLYKKGQSGNPAGRPKGTFSMKEWARQKLASMTEEEREDFMEGLPKEVIWKMSEGNPHSTTDGKLEVTIPKPILDNALSNNNIPTKDSEPEKED